MGGAPLSYVGEASATRAGRKCAGRRILAYAADDVRRVRRSIVVVAAFALAALSGIHASPAAAVASGTPLAPVARHTVFGGAVGVGNTLMEHDGTTNFALRAGGSEALVS